MYNSFEIRCYAIHLTKMLIVIHQDDSCKNKTKQKTKQKTKRNTTQHKKTKNKNKNNIENKVCDNAFYIFYELFLNNGTLTYTTLIFF